MREIYGLDVAEALKFFNSKSTGLSDKEAALRLKNQGIKDIGTDKPKSIFVKFLAQFTDLMVLILLISACVSMIIGAVNKSFSEIVDGGIILLIVVVNASFGVIQEAKAEKSMAALKKMTAPECFVLRENEVKKILTSQLVVGDVVVFEAGVIVPADLRIIEAHNLYLNESSLTGESVPVKKDVQPIYNSSLPLAERKNMAFKGTVVSSGRGRGVVAAVGYDTELGKIAKAVKKTQKELTPLQKSIKDVGKLLTMLILLMAGIIFILEVISRGNPMEAFLTAVAISVAAIPESMPAVITIIMSLGIARLSKQKAVIRRMHSVETLGCCDTICSDKTGTITQNKMTVKEVYSDQKFLGRDLPSSLLLNAILLCNDSIKNHNGYSGDPTETALCEYAEKFGFYKDEQEKALKRIDEISFDSNRKMMSTLNGEKERIIFCKGAVDVLIERCSEILINNKAYPLNDKIKREILLANEKMTKKALRVLAVAYRENAEVLKEENLVFLGLVGMIDPPRKETFLAVQKCKKAGMKPIMITGDHLSTAIAVAKEVGILDSEKDVLTGKDLDSLSDEKLLKKIDKIAVYARVSPENKSRIVRLLKEKGHIVAMTGDGVNDAPSLKAANIGIGMGQAGVDVVKEVADMIITDDNFATIVVAAFEGRKVYKNIQKTVKFLFAANMGEILSLFLMTIIFPSLTFLLPVQILFVNLITDSLPALALGVEQAEANIMTERPRKSKEGLFSNGHGLELVIMGLAQTAIIMLSYIIGLKVLGEAGAMTMAFYSLNMIQLFFMFAMRTENSVFKSNPFKNKMLVVSLLFGFGLLAIMAFTPLGGILGLVKLPIKLALLSVLMSISIVFISEIYKLIRKKHKKSRA